MRMFWCLMPSLAGTCRLPQGRGCPRAPVLIPGWCWVTKPGCNVLPRRAGWGPAALGVPRCEIVKALGAHRRDPPAAVLPGSSAVSWKWIRCPLDFNSRRKGHFITGSDKLQRDSENSIRRNSESRGRRGGDAADVWQAGEDGFRWEV